MRKVELIKKVYLSTGFVLVLIVFGMVVRIVQYQANRSLWVDEAALATGIVSRGFLGLFQSLEYNQCAPLGFLLVERFFVSLMGNGEYALRLFPLLMGIVSLWIFWILARRTLPASVLPIAMLLMASSRHLIYYSAEVKQYSTDLTVAMILFTLAIYLFKDTFSRRFQIGFAIIGAMAVWFSHPGIFILAAIGIVFTCRSLFCRQGRQWLSASPVFLVWACSFLINYFFVLRKFDVPQSHIQFWKTGFMPFPPVSLKDWLWFPQTFENMLRNPCGFKVCLLFIAVLLLIGALYYLKNRPSFFWPFGVSVLLALLASGLVIYPFQSRLILYLAPFIFVFVCRGLERVGQKIYAHSPGLMLLLVVLVIYYPLYSGIGLMIRPTQKEELKPVLSYIKQNHQEEDVIYLYRGAKKAFDYYNHYNNQYGLSAVNYNEGLAEPKLTLDEHIDIIERTLSDKQRVWFVFCHESPVHVQDLLTFYLDRMAERLDSFHAVGAATYLYRFSRPPASMPSQPEERKPDSSSCFPES